MPVVITTGYGLSLRNCISKIPQATVASRPGWYREMYTEWARVLTRSMPAKKAAVHTAVVAADTPPPRASSKTPPGPMMVPSVYPFSSVLSKMVSFIENVSPGIKTVPFTYSAAWPMLVTR